MLSYDQIVSMAQDVGKEAKRLGKVPYSLKSLNVDTLRRFLFPNIGSYRPNGWELVNYKTCDKTGMGHEDEPALTARGLKAWIKDLQRSDTNWAMAIIEDGEFQVVIGLFKPDSRDFTHTGCLTEGEMRIVGGAKR